MVSCAGLTHYPSMMYTNYPDTSVSGAPALLPSMVYPYILTNKFSMHSHDVTPFAALCCPGRGMAPWVLGE